MLIAKSTWNSKTRKEDLLCFKKKKVPQNSLIFLQAEAVGIKKFLINWSKDQNLAVANMNACRKWTMSKFSRSISLKITTLTSLKRFKALVSLKFKILILEKPFFCKTLINSFIVKSSFSLAFH